MDARVWSTIRKSMLSGHDPTGGYRFSEKFTLKQGSWIVPGGVSRIGRRGFGLTGTGAGPNLDRRRQRRGLLAHDGWRRHGRHGARTQSDRSLRGAHGITQREIPARGWRRVPVQSVTYSCWGAAFLSIVFSLGRGFSFLETALTIRVAQTIFQRTHFMGLVARSFFYRTDEGRDPAFRPPQDFPGDRSNFKVSDIPSKTPHSRRRFAQGTEQHPSHFRRQ